MLLPPIASTILLMERTEFFTFSHQNSALLWTWLAKITWQDLMQKFPAWNGYQICCKVVESDCFERDYLSALLDSKASRQWPRWISQMPFWRSSKIQVDQGQYVLYQQNTCFRVVLSVLNTTCKSIVQWKRKYMKLKHEPLCASLQEQKLVKKKVDCRSVNAHVNCICFAQEQKCKCADTPGLYLHVHCFDEKLKCSETDKKCWSPFGQCSVMPSTALYIM